MSADRIASFESSFGPLLRRYRAAAGLTQEELAARSGLSVRGISDLERGRKRTPHRDTVALLAEALALSPHKRALLEAAARPMMAPAYATPAAKIPPHNLPAQLTTVIGREREAFAAAGALTRSDVRLLTLTGPGGVGKTRLALQVAEDMLNHFEDGVFFVQLAPLTDAELVLPRIAAMVGLRVASDEPMAEQIRTLLRDKELLLVLDNFEHVLAAAPAIASLLADCPRLKALSTSREPLRIGGEHEQQVAPLTPEAAHALFLERARAAYPALEVRGGDVTVIAAICERVDRLPLALELAAVWVKVLPLPSLLERLESRLNLLTSGRRDVPERQRTLRRAIAWSEDLLSPERQRLFRHLAVFAGGCTVEAVEAICAEATASPGGALAGLAGLVEMSLLRAETCEEGPRFGMLETIREYALERLTESDEAEALRRRHAEYYAALVMRLGWLGPGQDARDRQVEHELPNAREALAWALERREPELGLRLATALGRFWYSRGSFDEGEKWLRNLLALNATGARAVPPELQVMALYFLTLYALDRHHIDQAEALALEGLELARQHGEAGGVGNMLIELGHVAEARGDLDAAMRFFEEGLAQYRAGGPMGAVGRALSSLGNLAREQGNHDLARRYLEEALTWARERQFSWAVASTLVGLGHVACEQQAYTQAAALYRESLGMYKTMLNPAALAWCLEGVAVVAVAASEYERAARLRGAITSLQRRAGGTPPPEWRPFSAAVRQDRQALGEDDFAAACAAGAALSPEQAVSYALAN